MERYKVLAARQHGVVTWEQMRALGSSAAAIRWRTSNGELEEVLPGVYRVAGSPRTWEQRLMAAVLWAGPGAVASYKSAAALWGFDGFSPGPVEISTLKQNRKGLGFKVHRTLVEPPFTTTKLGIPVTNAFRTLQDVVTVVSDERGNQTFDELLRKGLASMESLRRFVDREECSGRKGVGVLRRMVEQRSPEYRPSASELQAAAGRLLTAAGMAYIEEFVITDRNGDFVARVDFKLVEVPLVVEVDGGANHTSKLDREHDLDRDNRIVAEGYGVIHATADKVWKHPEVFLAEVAQAKESQLRRLT